ncbi:filamentous hemagglutinin N-terminal domain-containing protein [Caballeronia sp. GAWG1-1]|uniref:two-partner secretion domain-containing protein n=1 Tax=Caballeronia sp. GAWG1-1 TaxID=2921742 RepID=UPI002028901E|nr:filamentous hemagglutinin N-terminal domain-containing protein [Caballeronia sp. GAWG1-1]
MRLFVYRLAGVSTLGDAACVSTFRAPGFTVRALPLLIALASAGSFLHAPGAEAAPPLPQGGKYVAGSGTIAQSGGTLNIKQSGTNGIINWTSFSIGAGNTVSINNGTGATLNRVTGNDMSAIYGTLKSTGSVYLINPHGVLIGPTGVVATGGRFVASTLDTDNDSFMNSPDYFTLGGSSNASVINLGKISSSGGDVFLISAKSVMNAGSISAPKGTAELVTAREVVLADSAYGQQVGVQTTGTGGDVTNSGTIQAALISLQAADGNIFALAGKSGALRATGTETRDGHVWLVAQGGTVDARGATISARNADGSGGTVDMTGNAIKLSEAKVGAGQWNITAPTFTADAAPARTLAANLSSGTSITVHANGADATKGAGDINVTSNIRWNGSSSLTLDAGHSVTIAPGATIANTGAGSLTLRADASAVDNGGSVTNRGTLDWSHSTGIVSALYDMTGSYTPGTVHGNASWSAAPFSGLLTQVTAYQLVNSIADLHAVKNNLGGTYALGSSLELDGATGLSGIGSAAQPFTGQFDGMGHLLSDLNIPSGANTGLFGVVGPTGIVRNVLVDSATASSSGGPVGVLAGTNYGYLVNVASTGIVNKPTGAATAAGGLVGINRGRIERSWSGAQVNGDGEIGGLVGENDGYIGQSYTVNFMTAAATATIGGLAGVNSGTIEQSYSQSFVNGGAYIGGLVGNNTGTIRQSYSTASLSPGTGSHKPGAIAGTNSGTIAKDVFWDKETSVATAGVGSGKAMSASSGLTSAQMATPASFGPTWDFSSKGTWSLPDGAEEPVLRWTAGL